MTKLKPARFSYTVFDLTIDEQIELAVLAEDLGFDAAWFGEHIVVAYDKPSVFMPDAKDDPTANSGLPRSIYDNDTKLYDLLVQLGAVARETRRIAIMTGIFLSAFRHPLVTARAAATLDELTRGRFHLGLGAGWNKDEFNALGAPFEERGPMLDETVDVLKLAMRGGPFHYDGRHYSFGEVQISKQPFQVPLLFGGHSTPALRRAARIGDGWVSTVHDNVGAVVQARDTIDKLREQMGTADRPFAHWVKANTDDPEEIDRLRAEGIDHFVLFGDRLWGAGDVPFATRCRRLREVAAAMGIGER